MFDRLIVSLVSPLGMAILLGVISLGLATRNRGNLAILFGSIALLWLTGWSLPVVSHAFRHYLEQQYPLVEMSELPSADAIVVLGGSVDAPRQAGYPPNLKDASDRVWHAARLFAAGKSSLVVLSGGSSDGSTMSEAEAMRVFLMDLGVPSQAVLLEPHSRNTRENAAFTARLLQDKGVNTVLLVTSALHMPRAFALFSVTGLSVSAAATDYEGEDQHPHDSGWLPSARALEGSARAWKELIGQASGR